MSAAGSRWSALTPRTEVGMSLPLAGAVITTFLAPAVMCLPAPGPSRKTPVPSMTMSMPISFHGNFNGSLSATTWMMSPSTEMVLSSITLTSALNVPKIESYLSKCAAGLAPPDWLTQTTWSGQSGPRVFQHQTKLRPMRPKPLIATLILSAATTVLLTAALATVRFLNWLETAENCVSWVVVAVKEAIFLGVWMCGATGGEGGEGGVTGVEGSANETE